MRQHPLICIKFTRSALNENPHLHGSIFPQAQVLQPWPLQCQLKDEVDLLATKSKSYFSFYRNPPSFGSPNSFRINPIGFFQRPMPNILIFIKLFNQMFNRNLFWALNTNRKLSLQNIITFVFMITTLREYKVPLSLSLTLSAIESFIYTTSLQAGRYLWTQQKWSTCDNGISAGLGSCSSCWDGKRNMIHISTYMLKEKTVQKANFFFLLNRRNRIQSSKKCSEKKRNFLFKQFISRSRGTTVDLTRTNSSLDEDTTCNVDFLAPHSC